jgi:hypothetical protein
MRAFGRFLFSFDGLLWTSAVVAGLALLAYPLARNLYASYTWDKVPCWYSPATHTWYFDRDGNRYVTDVPDFWTSFTVPARPSAAAPITRPFDDAVYVSRTKPYEAVHLLNAHTNWERAMPRIVIVGFIVGVALFLTLAAKKTKRVPVA